MYLMEAKNLQAEYPRDDLKVHFPNILDTIHDSDDDKDIFFFAVFVDHGPSFGDCEA